VAALIAIQYFVIDHTFRLDDNDIWLFSGLASLVFASRVLNPHYTPTDDAAVNAFFALAAILVAIPVLTSSAQPSSLADQVAIGVALAWSALVFLTGIAVLSIKKPGNEETRTWLLTIEKIVRGLGSATVIYTVVILAAVWLFHRQSAVQVLAILGAWVVISLRPIEHLFELIRWARNRPPPVAGDTVGHICAYQSPGIVLLRQTDNQSLACGTVLLVSDEYGPATAGVVLNEVGRDEGNLVRVLSQPFPEGYAAPVGKPGTAQIAAFTEEQRAAVPILSRINSLCGIVDTDTDLLTLQMEVINDQELAEGRLVEATIGKDIVLYQIIQGVTRDEVVQQKNKYGYVRAAARKIGAWDVPTGRFRPVPWLPPINSPVFLRQTEDAPVKPEAVGHFPDTSYHIAYEPSDGVTHNTAILGILGVGKSYLALELVERMIAAGIKVVCLDLTNQYSVQLAPFIDDDHEEALDEELRKAGAGREVKPDVEAGGSRPAFRKKVREQLEAFLAPESGRFLRILNPSQFEVTRQDSKPYQGNAAMATLTAAEVTAIFSEEALAACQAMGMTDEARLCLVYEEAHTLIPEWNSVAADGDKQATAASARAILQGRKYGLGCLLITQRTANVTKSILNQCNSVFALRSFDDTSKDFLSNYIGRDYAQVLPTLPQRHAVFFGKASSSSNPVMIRVNDREAFVVAFRAAHPPPALPAKEEAPLPAAGEEGPAPDPGPGAAPIEDLDDDVPF
jgi:hypothetical protein